MKTNILKTLLQTALILQLVSGCAQNVDGTWKAPFVYRIDVQQGNVVDQEMIDKLKPGMDKNQVKFILGTPLVADPFHSNRWDYVYSYEPGSGERQQRRITVYFKDDKLSHIDGDIEVKERTLQAEVPSRDRSVDVPLERYEEGFFSTLFDDDEPTADPTAETIEDAEDVPVSADETDAVETPAATTTAEPPATEPVAAEVTPEAESSPEESNQGWRSETVKSETAAESSSEKTARGSTIDSDQDKNLLRRFWDRMTSDESESGVESGEETERDLRDAEVFKDAGGDL